MIMFPNLMGYVGYMVVFVKIHWFVHLRFVHFTTCKLYLKKILRTPGDYNL